MKEKTVPYFVVLVLLVAFGVLGVPLATYAAANDVTFSDDVTLYFPSVSGVTLMVLGGSTAESYTVSDESVSFTMQDTSSVSVRSLAGKQLSVNIGTFSCGGGFSSASRTSTAAETFTITVSNTDCVEPRGGGGGGGGGGVGTAVVSTPAATPTPVVTATPTPAPATQQTTPQVTAPTTIQVTGGTPFTKRLAVGSKGSDVQQLQEMLVNDGVYPEGIISGTYGQLTRKAVQKFQEKYGIAKQGDPGYGDVGPNTRVKLNQVLEGTPASVPTVPTAPAQGAEQAAVRVQLETQIRTLQEQLVALLAELAKQLQSQVQ